MSEPHPSLLDQVRLLKPLPLVQAGEIGTIVDIPSSAHDTFTVEFADPDGVTICLVDLCSGDFEGVEAFKQNTFWPKRVFQLRSFAAFRQFVFRQRSKPINCAIGIALAYCFDVVFLMAFHQGTGSQTAFVLTVFTFAPIIVVPTSLAAASIGFGGAFLSLGAAFLELRFLRGMLLRVSFFVHTQIWLVFGVCMSARFSVY